MANVLGDSPAGNRAAAEGGDLQHASARGHAAAARDLDRGGSRRDRAGCRRQSASRRRDAQGQGDQHRVSRSDDDANSTVASRGRSKPPASPKIEPGSYTLKLAVVDSRGRRGSVEHPFTAGLTRVGSIDLADFLLDAGRDQGTRGRADRGRPDDRWRAVRRISRAVRQPSTPNHPPTRGHRGRGFREPAPRSPCSRPASRRRRRRTALSPRRRFRSGSFRPATTWRARP